MSESNALPNYSRFDQVLESIGLDQGASETHGVLCGSICTGTSEAHVDWIEELFQERPSADLLVREARQMLGQLYLASRQQMDDEGLEFSLLLPQDDAPLAERAKALRNWCEGYLYGLGMAGVSQKQLGEDASEALNDISEITRLDLDSLEDGEVNESAYMELQEFLRVATLLIREELKSVQENSHAGD
jgi:uncharacterized protein